MGKIKLLSVILGCKPPLWSHKPSDITSPRILMNIIAITLISLVSIIFSFPIYKISFLYHGIGQELKTHRFLFPKEILYKKKIEMHHIPQSLEIQKLSIDHLLKDPVFMHELFNLSYIISDEFVKMIDSMPDPLELVSLYKNHKMYPKSFDNESSSIQLLSNLYVHHLKRSPKLWLELLKKRQVILRSIDGAVDRVYHRFQKEINSPNTDTSSLSLLKKLSGQVNSMLIVSEFHIVFRIILFELLLDLWDVILHSFESAAKHMDFLDH